MSRRVTNRLLSTLTLAFVALLTFVAPVARAEEAHPEYGTVIGIDLGTTYGLWFFNLRHRLTIPLDTLVLVSNAAVSLKSLPTTRVIVSHLHGSVSTRRSDCTSLQALQAIF